MTKVLAEYQGTWHEVMHSGRIETTTACGEAWGYAMYSMMTMRYESDGYRVTCLQCLTTKRSP